MEVTLLLPPRPAQEPVSSSPEGEAIATLTQAWRQRLEKRVRAEAAGGTARTIPRGHLQRDTPEGRQRIAEAIARYELGFRSRTGCEPRPRP